MATTKKNTAKANSPKKSTRPSVKSPVKDGTTKTAQKAKSPPIEAAEKKGRKPSVTMERRSEKDRRASTDRRQKNEPVAGERRAIQRRKKVNRRRQIDPTTCERDYTSEEIEFMNALDDYKRTSGRMFPTCSEVLEVLRGLGYSKDTCGQSPVDSEAASPMPVTAE